MSPQEKPPTEVPWGETVSHPARRSPKGIPHKIAYWRYPPLTGVACVARTRRAPLDETVTFVDGKSARFPEAGPFRGRGSDVRPRCPWLETEANKMRLLR